MKRIKAHFSGSWYPASADECEQIISGFVSKTGEPKAYGDDSQGWLCGVVPHAGWYYSGSIAFQVIQALSKGDKPDTIVIFGKHMHKNDPPTIMSEGSFETPFGDLPINEAFTGVLMDDYPFYTETPDRHTPENTIELQLPFVKHFFKDSKCLVIGVPPTDEAEVLGKMVVEIAKQCGFNIKIIGSTDLTHYGPNYGFVPEGVGEESVNWVKTENDKRIIDAALSADSPLIIKEGTSNFNACCSGALAATASAAKAFGRNEGVLLNYHTSYDTTPGDSFVGYAGIVY